MFTGEDYTVFVPTDHAFQRWHPIDWGFYPFSVPEFTESVIINHFVKGRLKQEDITNGLVAKTLGGRDVVFRKTRRYFFAIIYFFVILNVCDICTTNFRTSFSHVKCEWCRNSEGRHASNKWEYNVYW